QRAYGTVHGGRRPDRTAAALGRCRKTLPMLQSRRRVSALIGAGGVSSDNDAAADSAAAARPVRRVAFHRHAGIDDASRHPHALGCLYQPTGKPIRRRAPWSATAVTTTAPRTAPTRLAGPRMVVVATIALGLTAPGQTASISVFLTPMIDELEVSRTAVSTAYMVGTLTGALALPWIGRAVDRYGTRLTMTAIAACFSLALLGLSSAQDVIGLGAGFIGIRMLGQGALGLCAATLVSRWYDRRRGTVLGLQGALGGGLISLSPVLLERLITATDWRTAMHVEAAVIALVLVPVAVLLVRDRPADLGQFVDGRPHDRHTDAAEWGMTRGQAARHPYFWVLTATVGTAGFFGTAIGFHQIALLGERGLSATEAAANFLPQTIAGTAATFLLGYLVDRGRPRLLLAASMLGFALAVAWG